MKRKVFIFLVLILTIAFFTSINVAAAEQTPEADTTSETTSESAGLTSSDFDLGEENIDFSTVYTNIQHMNVELAISMLKAAILGSDEFYGYLSASTISSVLYTVFFPIGLLVMFISTAISFGQKAIDGSLFDEANGGKKAIIHEVVRLFSSIFFVMIGKKILELIDALVQIFTISMFEFDVQSFFDYSNAIANSGESYEASSIPIIGFFINLINGAMARYQTNFILFLVNLCMVVITIVLGIRIIKLAVFQGFSPVFFGMSAGEETRVYTKNFLVQYCVISAQILVISALVTALQTAIAGIYSAYSSGTLQFGLALTGGIIMLVFTIMIFKSDKLFERVLH